MYSKMLSFSSVLATLAVTALAAPTSSNPSTVVRRALNGQATTYDNGGNTASGTCMLPGLLPGVYGTALSDSNWDNAQNCGACITVNGPSGKPITAMIVDQCPGCGPNHLDLYPDAYKAATGQAPGRVEVSWDYIDCPIPVSEPLQVHFKTGASQYWFSAQVVNARIRTKSMEVSADGGSSWKTAQRQDYNYFQLSGGTGSSKVSIRLTSQSGSQVVLKDVTINPDKSVSASANYA